MGTAAVVGGVTVLALGLLFPPKVKTPTKKTGEIAEQKSKEGEPQPFVYGIARPIGGNVIYQSEPIKVIKKEKVSGGGKGKKKTQTQKVEYIYRYYAIRVCRGEVEYRRIWRNGKLVYDASATNKEQLDNNKLFLKMAKLYSGSWDQLPCPVLEGRLGVGNVPAYRGLAYMVIEYEDLTSVSGAIPQYVFEVARAPSGYTLTSKLYPYMTEESIGDFEYKFDANLRNKVRKVDILEKLAIKSFSMPSKHNGIAKVENDFSVANFVYNFSGGVRSNTVKIGIQEGINNFSYDFSGGIKSSTIKTQISEEISEFNYDFNGQITNKTIKTYPDADEIGEFEYSFNAIIKKG